DDLVAVAQVREVRALQALLPHPQEPEVDVRVVPRRATADHHQARVVAELPRRRDGVLARVLQHDLGRRARADDLPELLSERAGLPQPRGAVVEAGQLTPVVEVPPVDGALRAELLAEVR